MRLVLWQSDLIWQRPSTEGAMAHLRSAGVASTSGSDVSWRPSSRRAAARGPLHVAAVASPEVIFKPSGAAEVPKGLNKFSQTVTQHKSQAASLAQLYGTGLRDEDLDKPQAIIPTPPFSDALLHSQPIRLGTLHAVADASVESCCAGWYLFGLV